MFKIIFYKFKESGLVVLPQIVVGQHLVVMVGPGQDRDLGLVAVGVVSVVGVVEFRMLRRDPKLGMPNVGLYLIIMAVVVTILKPRLRTH